MSRIYEALRHSEADAGQPATLLAPDISLPMQINEGPGAGDGETLSLDAVVSLHSLPLPQARLVSLSEDNNLGAEKFRLLRARIRNLREAQQVHRLVVTSAVPEEGKTLVTMNLAISMAKHTTEKILMIEGDLRKPAFAKYLGMQPACGIGDWFTSNEPITKFMYRFDQLQLWVLPGGKSHENPLTILQSGRFLELYKQLSACFDWVLIDAPPLVPMADVNFWSRQVDGLLLVSRHGRTPRNILKKGLEVLDRPSLIGIVMNDAPAIESNYYHHYYYANTQSPAGNS